MKFNFDNYTPPDNQKFLCVEPRIGQLELWHYDNEKGWWIYQTRQVIVFTANSGEDHLVPIGGFNITIGSHLDPLSYDREILDTWYEDENSPL